MLEFIDAHFRHGLILMVTVLLVLVIAYRYYSAFLAAKVLALDPNRPTPAHTLNDGHNYLPTNKWVLFGHHFAAISGAGPLIGPVLAAQYGFLPGMLWILIGVCLAGAVQDFTILVLSTRSDGRSLAQLAYSKIGPIAGTAATIGILFVLIIAIAGLGKVVTKALGGEKVTYTAGTQFTAFEKTDQPGRYLIPKGAKVIYANGATAAVTAPITLNLLSAKSDGPSLIIPPDVTATETRSGSAWGTFTIALTIPIALLIGLYMYRIRKGRVFEASLIGGVLTLGAVWLGGKLDDPSSFLHSLRPYLDLTEPQVAIAMAAYGFIASVLPVWFLLCPRDYLSSFLKIGTVILLVLGVILANPDIHSPALNTVFLGGGPVVKFSIFPFVFITIMCGAISGFHSLVSSGTTPKMLDNENHARPIGYGAMLIEGLVGLVALIAAASLPTNQYYDMNTAMKDLPDYQQKIAQLELSNPAGQPLQEMADKVHENLQGRTGGAVTLAIGMANIFDGAARKILGGSETAIKAFDDLIPYWYHFAIMFEALFILTTIDTGTRVGRFLLQETFGKWIHPALGRTDSWPSAILATALIVLGWWYFISAKSMDAIWPMFGIANQMLAVMALAIATVGLAQMGKRQYLWVTLAPMAFVTATTTSAAVILLQRYLTTPTADNILSATCILAILLCTAIIVTGSLWASFRPMESLAQTPAGSTS